MMGPRARLVAKAAAFSFFGLLLLALLLLLGETLAVRRLQGGLGAIFVDRGDRLASAGPGMVRFEFEKLKPPGEFRVFVFGGSQAMGSPYVHQGYDDIVSFFGLLRMPNRGGISTWLEQDLQAVLPGRRVRVFNAAMGARDLADAKAAVAEALGVGGPDLVVLLSGNNERRDRRIKTGLDLAADGALLDDIVRSLTVGYKAGLAGIVGLLEARRTPAYFLTVATNIRDWLPSDAQEFDLAGMERLIGQGRTRQALDALKGGVSRGNALALFFTARAHEAAGDYGLARRYYLAAKDRDRSFLRCRTPWQDAIRAVRSPSVRVIDIERIVSEKYARHGLPGNDLFHDYCHFRLEANRRVAYEVARAFAQDSGLPLEPLEKAAASPAALWSPGELRALYLLESIKWFRWKYYSLNKKVRDANTRAVMDGYERAYEEWRQVRVLRGVAGRPPGALPEAAGPGGRR
ncbi:MAG: hypothetical protein HY927_00495 [Elusimicrobia bacterium]|nr:hypothetical protein [Elusimicrobiota bacterium]